MAVSLKHLFQSAKADGPDATLVQPSNWNAEHVLTQAADRLLGRTTSGTGPTEEITVGTGLTFSGGVLSSSIDPSAFVSLTGDQTIGGLKTFTSAVAIAAGTATTHAVRGDRSVAAGTGLTGGGNLTADRTLALTGQALALHNLATNGIIVRTGTGTMATRTLTAGTGISITNANGVSGNPTITATAPTTAGAVGTYAALLSLTNTIRTHGTTVAGSSLRYASFNGGPALTAPPGTWRCMGYAAATTFANSQSGTIWLRIS